jgi:hypothetical protein
MIKSNLIRTSMRLLGHIRKIANVLGISLVVARPTLLQKGFRVQSFD